MRSLTYNFFSMVQFFELIQVAIGVREKLTVMPRENEWVKLFSEALHQGLIGITYVGVQKLIKQSECTLPRNLLLKWSGAAVQLKVQNTHVSAQGARVLRYFIETGFQAIIIKGQSHLPNYPEHLRDFRVPGDIDVWVRGENTKQLFHFLQKDYPDDKFTYLHIHLHVFSDTPVEIHYRPSYLFNPIYNHRLQYWFKSTDLKSLNDQRVFRDFNAIYQPLHLYRHLAWEGISIRQLLDYYFLLKQHPVVDDAILKSFGIYTFHKDLSEVVYNLFEDKPMYTSSSKILKDDILIYGKLGSNPLNRARYRVVHLTKFYSKDFLWLPLTLLYQNIWRFYVRLFY